MICVRPLETIQEQCKTLSAWSGPARARPVGGDVVNLLRRRPRPLPDRGVVALARPLYCSATGTASGGRSA
jgi:hypothetical protein